MLKNFLRKRQIEKENAEIEQWKQNMKQQMIVQLCISTIGVKQKKN